MSVPVEPVSYEVRDMVAVVTLNRPQALNAVNAPLATAIGQALTLADADEGVRVIIVTANGRAFCAGADLKEIAAGRSIEPVGHPEWGFAGLVQHWVNKPLIAAVNGFAMGGGTEIVLACDLAVATTDATFGLPEVKRGLIAAAGGVLRTQRQIPMKRALEIVLCGQPIDAATALEWGLLNRVVEAKDLLATAFDLALQIVDNAPLSVRHSKQMVHRAAQGLSDWNPAWNEDPWVVNAQAREAVFSSQDAREGASAFTEKRPPVWQGR